MARRFFYVCAGLLLFTAAYQLGARNVNAQASTTLAAPTEVATLSGTLHDGQTIPLPVYADGTTALESECRWTVSADHYYNRESVGGGSYLECFTGPAPQQRGNGRVVNCYEIREGAEAMTFDVNYLIIATRGAASPTPATTQSFGALKTKYR